MIKIEIENAGIQELRFQNIAKAIADYRPVWPSIQAYMLGRIALQFDQLRRGGHARSVVWKDFAPQYTRKDGTEVPAWGIPGEVQGRLRDSTNIRVTPQSNLMRNTSKMFAGILQDIRMKPTVLEMDSAGSPEQIKAQNQMRPWQYFEDPVDVDVIESIMIKHVERSLE